MTNEKALVVLNEQHSLLPDQKRKLDRTFGGGWEIFPVPAEGWTRDQMEVEIHLRLEEFRGVVVFASPIPLLIKLCTLSMALLDIPWGVMLFHNDRRVAKEVPDGKGGTKIIHTIAPEGWELV